MSEQATVTVRGIEITLTRSMVAERANSNTVAPAVSASYRCSCRTTLNYGGGVNRPGKFAVRGLLHMIDEHGPMHERFTR